MLRFLWLFVVASLTLGLTGCTLNYPGSKGGRSGHVQLMESQAYNQALESAEWPTDLTGAKVYVEAHGLTEDTVDSDYLRIAIQDTLFREQLRPQFVGTAEEAEYVVQAMVESLGTDTYGQTSGYFNLDLVALLITPLFKYDYYARSFARVRLTVYAQGRSYNDQQLVNGSTKFVQYRLLLGLIGPFRYGNFERP